MTVEGPATPGSSATPGTPASVGTPVTPAPSTSTAPVESALGAAGLTSAEAAERLRVDGPNTIAAGHGRSAASIALSQVASPLVVILVVASILSAATGDTVEATIILVIVGLSALLGFVQESRSEAAVAALRARLALRTTVIRDAVPTEILARDLVRGDLVALSAGDVVAADGTLTRVNHLFVDEAALTGEAAPAGKVVAQPGRVDPDSEVFFGTSVVSGTAQAVITATGARTAYGAIARHLLDRPPDTDFQRGIRAFGLLIARITLLLVVGVLAINVALHRPVIESLLFAVALAVGLTPELLPAIVTYNLSRGARHLAAIGVLVKRLPAIQNMGSMTILCTDKTGTLTEGRLRVERVVAADGSPSPDGLRLACLNSGTQAGFRNPLDDALIASTGAPADIGSYTKLAELPYDFQRRCLSVLLGLPDGTVELITKGAPDEIVARSSSVELATGTQPMDESLRAKIATLASEAAADGYRTIAVASRPSANAASLEPSDESGLVFRGLVLLADPPKAGIGEVLARLAELHVALKIVTGDDPLVARHVAEQVGLAVDAVLTGDDMDQLTHDAFVARAQGTTIFARVNPDQKLRVIRALRERGSIVGYLGDGINDAPSLHAADVGISVDNATDVARAAADIVLLQPSLDAIGRGVAEGRRTFANTLKYIRMGTSSNFGNMFSMAGSALILPFLPMLPSQILLNNLIYDVSQAAIPSDGVDPEVEAEPSRWDIAGIERFMVVFGPISSVFDFLTFGLLLVVLHADEPTFHAGWFIESLTTQILVIFAIRTRRTPFWRSRPSRVLTLAALGAVVVGAAIPLSPIAGTLGFVGPPLVFWPLLAAMAAAYLLVIELVKRWVFRPAVGAASRIGGTPGASSTHQVAA